MYRWCVIELHTLNLYNFINQYNRNLKIYNIAFRTYDIYDGSTQILPVEVNIQFRIKNGIGPIALSSFSMTIV